MSTNAYVAKKALFDLWDANNGPAQALAGVQVAYAFPAAPDMKCIYGGGITFEHSDASAETPGILVRESVLVSAYIRVVARPVGEVADTDAVAAQIGGAMLGLVKANPKLAGPLTWVGVRGGQGDYQQTDDETISILGYQFRFLAHFQY